jgi:hypothetical protein
MPAASQPWLQQQLPSGRVLRVLSADLPDIMRLHTLFFLRDCWRSVPGGIPLAPCRQHARCKKGGRQLQRRACNRYLFGLWLCFPGFLATAGSAPPHLPDCAAEPPEDTSSCRPLARWLLCCWNRLPPPPDSAGFSLSP